VDPQPALTDEELNKTKKYFCTTRCFNCMSCVCKRNKEACSTKCKCGTCKNVSVEKPGYPPPDWSYKSISFAQPIPSKHFGPKYYIKDLTPLKAFELFCPHYLIEHVYEMSNLSYLKKYSFPLFFKNMTMFGNIFLFYLEWVL